MNARLIDYATFFQGIFDKARLLDLIQNFLCFDKADGKAWKILGAYHQYFAVNKALQRTFDAVKGDGKIGVFWHTQGSGKSFSMLFFTHLIIRHFAERTSTNNFSVNSDDARTSSAPSR